MKPLYVILSILLSTTLSASGQSYHTITSQAEFDNATFANFCVVELDNDTTLPVEDQIHDLSPLQSVDSVFLTMRNTRISDGSPLADLIELRFWVKGDRELSDLSFLNNIPRLGGIFLRELPHVKSIDLSSNSEILSQLVIENCDNLTNLEVDLPVLEVPENPNHCLNVSIRYNDSLEHIAIRNPNEAVHVVDVEENRKLKEVYIEHTTALWLSFNPVLERVKGFDNDTLRTGFRAEFNYSLEDICDVRPNIIRMVEYSEENNLPVENILYLNQNGSNTSTWQDILDYPCAPAGVNGSYAASMHIYPNPTTGLLQVEGLSAPAAYRLLNLQGQVVQRGIAQPQQPLHFERVPEGLYFLELEGAAPLKVVKR